MTEECKKLVFKVENNAVSTKINARLTLMEKLLLIHALSEVVQSLSFNCCNTTGDLRGAILALENMEHVGTLQEIVKETI